MIQKEVLTNLIKEKFSSQVNQQIYGLEIGTLGGDCLFYLLKNIPNLKMITIDPSPQWTTIAGRLDEYKERLRILHMKSDEAIYLLLYDFYRKNLLVENGFDFIWIDGDHKYEQVKRDILNYLPLVKIGGIFGGHDYGSHTLNGVKQAVDELIKDKGYGLQIEEDGVWYVNV